MTSFARELEDDLVPEWRVKYFNYKVETLIVLNSGVLTRAARQEKDQGRVQSP